MLREETVELRGLVLRPCSRHAAQASALDGLTDALHQCFESDLVHALAALLRAGLERAIQLRPDVANRVLHAHTASICMHNAQSQRSEMDLDGGGLLGAFMRG